jgi:hypothetical protein
MNEPKIELQDRLQLIESMIQEGRSTTGYWGWSFCCGVQPTWSPSRGATSCRTRNTAGPSSCL